MPVGLWSEDATLRFYAPRDPTHVSHSIVNLQETESYFEARCRSIASLMAELGHDRQIGRAHVCTPVTHAHLVCRLLLEQKKTYTKQYSHHITRLNNTKQK